MENRIKEYDEIVSFVSSALENDKLRTDLVNGLQHFSEDWINLVNTIRRMIEGERDEESLLESLNYIEAAIIYLILQNITYTEVESRFASSRLASFFNS